MPPIPAWFRRGPMTGVGAPVATLADFVNWARANPRTPPTHHPRQASLPHFFGVMLSKGTGGNCCTCPFNGSAPIKTAIVGADRVRGRYLPDLVELHRAGKIRVLGVSGAQRAPQLPEGRPSSTGLARYRRARLVSASTRRQVRPSRSSTKLNAAIVKALALPDVREKLLVLRARTDRHDGGGIRPHHGGDMPRAGARLIPGLGFKAD